MSMSIKEILSLAVGDTIYEFDYGEYIEAKIVSPVVQDGKVITWKARNVLTGEEIDYMVNIDCMHYAPKIYTYMAYCGCKQV